MHVGYTVNILALFFTRVILLHHGPLGRTSEKGDDGGEGRKEEEKQKATELMTGRRRRT